MSNTALFLVPALIWGSTWHAITWQLGNVAPEVSITYRFSAASLILVLCAAFACASGNLIAMRNHDAGIPTIPGTAWMMIYGTLFASAVAKVSGAPWTFDARPAYVLSLAYLAVGGSVVAFVTYFALLKRVGAGPSSYVAIATPVIALLLSTFLEGYQWTPGAAAGMALAVFGNGLALRTASAAR